MKNGEGGGPQNPEAREAARRAIVLKVVADDMQPPHGGQRAEPRRLLRSFRARRERNGWCCCVTRELVFYDVSAWWLDRTATGEDSLGSLCRCS